MVDLSRFQTRSNPVRPKAARPSIEDIEVRISGEQARANLLDDDVAAPDARRALTLSSELGYPANGVSADVNSFEQEARERRDAETLQQNPPLAGWLQDALRASASKDDIQPLGDIAKLFGAPGQSTLQKLQGGTSPYALGMRANTRQLFPGRVGTPAPRAPERRKATIGSVIKGLDQGIAAQFTGAALGVERYVADMLGLGEEYAQSNYAIETRKSQLAKEQASQLSFDTKPAEWAYNAATSLGVMGGSLVAGPARAIGVLGTITGAGAYERFRERGAGAVESAFGALGTGLTEGVLEKYGGFGYLLGNFGKEATKKLLGGLLLREIPSELATTTIQNAIDTAVSGGGTWEQYWQNLPQDLMDTAGATAFMVGGLGAMNAAARKLSPEAKAVDDGERAVVGAAVVDQLMAQAEKSKLKGEAPETFREYVAHVIDSSGTPVRDIYIPVEAILELQQSEGYEPETLAPYADQIAAAQGIAGGEVVIPIADAAAFLGGTAAWEALKDSARVLPGGVSMKEAREEAAERDRVLEQRGAEIAAEVAADGERASAAAEVYTDVKNRLLAGGVAPTEAEGVAQVVAARYETRGNAQGVTPMQAWQEAKVSFGWEGQPAVEGAREVAQEDALIGMPQDIKVDGVLRRFGPYRVGRQAAAKIAKRLGIKHDAPKTYARVDPERAARIATEFELMEHNPSDPEVKAAYQAMIDETVEQYKELMKTGLKVEFITGADPYGNPRNAIIDVVENNHLWVYPTDAGFGGPSSTLDVSDNPLLQIVPGIKISGKPVRANDLFRVVHDFFGHIMEGVGFRADGEENAWRIHSAMYSPLARRAMTTETRGQNSWVNFGPFGEKNRTASGADTEYAPQKIGLLPAWVSEEGADERTLEQSELLPTEQASSIQAALEVARSQKFANQRDFKSAMQKAVNAFKGNKRKRDRLLRLALNDARVALQNNANAVGWYDEKVEQALAVFATIHPEIENDVDARFAFIYALAVTSNGLKVGRNFELADEVYREWQRTGKMPVRGEGTAQKAMEASLNLFNSLTERFGFEGLHEIMMRRDITVKELGDLVGVPISGEHKGTRVTGAAFLGPKIGNGFFSNLYGNFDQLTMDRWFIRTWGRWTGTLIVEDKAKIKEKRDKVKALLRSLTPEQRAATEKALKYKISLTDVDGFAKRVATMTSKADVRDKLAAIHPRLRLDPKALHFLLDGQKEAPQGPSERNEIRAIMTPVLEELQKENPALTMADLQAVLWYPEKTLYATATAKVGADTAEGYEDDEAPDYANAAVALARYEGVSQEKIDAALEAASQRVADRAYAANGAGRTERGFGDVPGFDEERGPRELFQDVIPEAGWTPERVSGLIDFYEREDGKTSAIAVMMSPDEFLGLNASAEGRRLIEERVTQLPQYGGRLDAEQLAKSDPISLAVSIGAEPSNFQKSIGVEYTPGMVQGHAGRHRMMMLKRAGVERVPVVVELYDKGQRVWVDKPTDVPAFIGNRSRGDQTAIGDRQGSITQGIPLNQKHHTELSELSDSVVLFQDKAKPRGSVTFLADGAKLISLFETANRSTLLHEFSHVWLEEIREDALRDGASAQTKADWKALKKWSKSLGFTLSDTAPIPTPFHEFFARGGERYFMEGKAPRADLAPAFKRFAAWLTRIYQVVLNLNSPINPEIREVFDRLLATQEAIDAYREQQRVEPLFKSAEDAGMTEDEFAAYQRSVTEARDEAFNTLLFKTMEGIRRRRTAEMRDKMGSIRSEVAEAINGRPEFIALHLLRTGRWLGDPDRERQDIKLNTGWLIDTFGEDILTRLPKGLPITRGDGLDGDAVAEIVGAASGQELVHALVGMRAASEELRASGETRSLRDKMIADEVEREAAERFGDPFADGSIEEEAIAALNTAKQGEIIAGEIRQLGKRASITSPQTPYQFAREWAKRTIVAGYVRDVASRAAVQRYIRATAKASRAAEKAILEGDVDEAYRQKQAQLLNHALLAESKKAADKVDTVVARLQRYAKRAAMKSVDQDYMDKVHLLLENYDLRERSLRSIDEQEGFQKWAEGQRAKGFEVHIPPRLENRGVPYSKVTVEELLSLNDLVESLIHLGKTKKKIMVAQAERDFDELVDEAVATVERLPQRKLPTVPVNEEARPLASGAAELLKVETIAEELDGGKTGIFNDVLVVGAAAAENKRTALRDKVMQPIADAYRKLGRKQWKRYQEKVTIPELTWNTLNEGDPRVGQPVTMTRLELLSMVLNTGNLSNLEKLSKGERWPVATIRAVADRELSKEDWDFVQMLWTQVNTLWPDIVAVERELSGVVPEQVVSTPIETRFGTYEGGYWPVVYDAARWQRAEDLEGKRADDMFGIKSGTATQKGHTITRTEAFGPISFNLENVLFQHLEAVVTRIAFSAFARDMLRFVRNERVRGIIDTRLGPEYRKQFEPWLARQVQEGMTDTRAARWWGSLLKQARINMTIAAMGFRFSTGIAQTLGLTASAQRIGARYVGTGLKRLATNPRKMAQFVFDRSPEMVNRNAAVNREVAEVFSKMRGKHSLLTEAQAMAFWHIGMIDRYVVSIPTWLGAHQKGLDQGLTDQEASTYADKAVRMSQGAGGAKDLSRIQGDQHPAMRFFTLFYTPFNVMFNAQWQGVRGLKKSELGPMIGVTFWWMIASTLGDALLSGDDPDWGDEQAVLGWFGRNVFFGMFAGIPLVRDLAGGTERKVIGEYADIGSTPVTRVYDSIEKVYRMGDKFATEGEAPKRPLKQIADLTALLTGTPVSQAGTTGQFLWDYQAGEADPQSISDWYFGITRGKVPESEAE